MRQELVQPSWRAARTFPALATALAAAPFAAPFAAAPRRPHRPHHHAPLSALVHERRGVEGEGLEPYEAAVEQGKGLGERLGGGGGRGGERRVNLADEVREQAALEREPLRKRRAGLRERGQRIK